MLSISIRNPAVACLLLANACGATSPPADSPAARPNSSAATTSAANPAGGQTEPPIEPGSPRDAELEPSITVVGEALTYGGSAVGGVAAEQITQTLARLSAKLEAAKKYWPGVHQSPFPSTLPLELGGQHRALLLKELLQVATTTSFVNVELRVHSKGSTELVRLSLRPPQWQDSPRLTKRLHVIVASQSRYLLSWLEGDTVVSTPYRELFAAPPAGLDLAVFLAEKINEEWLVNGQHRAAIDPLKDVAVLHLNDALALDELLVVTRALDTPVRKWQSEGKVVDVPAFDLYVDLD